MDLNKVSRFEVKEQLGEGSFSNLSLINSGKLYKAYDKIQSCDVALKVEKEDKSKKILKFEYEILRNLQSNITITKV